jgi:hypothetical protein
MVMARKLKLPDGFDPHFAAWAERIFDRLGLDDTAAQLVVDEYSSYSGQRIAAAEVQARREVDAYKAELGSGAAKALADGQRAARSLGLSAADVGRLSAENGTATTLRLLAAVGARLGSSASGDATLLSRGGGGGDGPLSSPEQARAEIAKLQASPAWREKLFNKNAEGHRDAVNRWTQLHAAAYPNAEPSAPPTADGPTDDTRARWAALPADVRAATQHRDSGGNARDRIDAFTRDESFMGRLRSGDQAARAEMDAAQREAGDKL